MNKSSVLSGIHVLLVDGNHDTRRIIEVGLSQYGAFVTVVSSAQAGVVVLDQMTPDVIVADLTMPIDDGYWLIAQIRKQHRRSGCRQLPTVAVTPYGENVGRAAVAAEFNASIAKPLDVGGLCWTIQRLLDRTS
jgi:CheY-like chemotaxis protein